MQTAMYQDLAHLYDRIYSSKDYESESAALERIILDRNPGARTLLDVACGTGGHLVHLNQNFECEGLDINDGMLEIARSKVPGVPLHTADMTGFELGRRFDAVVCMFSAVGHLKTVKRLNAAVACMSAHLTASGVLAIEPWITPEDWLVGHVGLDTYEDDEIKVARMSVAEPVDRGRLVMEFLIGTKAGVTRLRDEHEMGWFTRSEYRAAFEAAGLSASFEKPQALSRGLYVGVRGE